MLRSPAVALILLMACASPEDAQILRHSVQEDDGLVHHDLAYGSDGLRIYGSAVVPAEPGPWPVVLFNHGGFSGMGASDHARMDELARRGVAVFASEFRGEGRSDGDVEYCFGEVDDVVRFATVAEEIDNVDVSAISTVGFSHGACISLFLRQRLPALRGSVTMGTPTEIDVHIQWHRDEGNADFADRWEGFVAGLGREKSPLYADHTPPIVMLHGEEDATVPPLQACLLYDMLMEEGWSGGIHRYTAGGEAAPGAIGGCARDGDGEDLLEDPAADLGVVLAVYDGAEHEPNDTMWNVAFDRAVRWLK